MANRSSQDHSSTSLSEPVSQARNWRNALVLMRIPFSIFLMPVFWFALSNSQDFELWNALWVFIIIHVFLYPASNGYNSYFDRDEESIGGLEKPPTVTNELFLLVILFDVLAVFGGCFISPLFAAMIFAYTLVSKAYSYDKIRLKRFPITSTVVVTSFQGAFTYLTVLVGIGVEIDGTHLAFAAVSTLLIAGSYPLTQIYQHKEDSERGDQTLSLMLGVRGTFIFSAVLFALGFISMQTLYMLENRIMDLITVVAATAPIGAYFVRWMWLSWKDEAHVNFRNTMNMNAISSLALSAAFIAVLLMHLYLA